MRIKSYLKSVYIELSTGRIDQATKFGKNINKNNNYKLLGHWHSFTSILSKSVEFEWFVYRYNGKQFYDAVKKKPDVSQLK